MPSKADVVTAAQMIIMSGKFTYGQVSGTNRYRDDKMDCSEFVETAFRNAGYTNFPRWKTSHDLAAILTPVKDDDIQPGDVLYWRFPDRGHVAIVEHAALGTMLHAASEKSGIRADSFTNGWWVKQINRKALRYSEKE